MREVDGKKEYLDEVTNEWVSKNELKKRNTLRKKEKDAAEKAAKKAATAKPSSKKADKEEEEVDPSKYTDNRKTFLQNVRDQGKNPYPHKFSRDMTIPQFRQKFEEVKIEAGEFLEDQKVSLTGRIMMLRQSGPKLMFIDLNDDC